MKFNPKIKPGDILLMRAFDWFGFIVHLIFPPSPLKWPSKRKIKWPSVHNGIFGTHNNIEGVFEARVKEHFHFTAWKDYERKLKTKKIEIKVARLKNLPADLVIDVSKHLNQDAKLKFKYDVAGVLSLTLNTLLGTRLSKRHTRRGWYCTEAIAHVFNKEGIKLFSNTLPSPFDIEKKISEGQLIEVADYY